MKNWKDKKRIRLFEKFSSACRLSRQWKREQKEDWKILKKRLEEDQSQENETNTPPDA